MSSSNAPPPPPELLCKECSQPLPKKQRTSSFSRRTPDALPGAKSSGKDATDASSDASDASGPSKFTDEERINLMKGACETILQCIGEDNEREGLLKTPERWAKALLFLTQGYSQTVEEVTNNAVFEEGLGGSQDMVVVRDIDIHSLCEHHMVPFTGKVHVGYIPRQKVLGISKMARIAEMFSRRLQVQVGPKPRAASAKECKGEGERASGFEASAGGQNNKSKRMARPIGYYNRVFVHSRASPGERREQANGAAVLLL